MAIPPEFKFASEDDFIQRYLVPLLQRLGFSMVVNYHGHAEFGKDLIFAELDRFGHVRYHGLQAKYEASISLNGIESLISDCRQAFANPFTHPQTGTTERLSSFYAVNGGSIGPEATQHFFNSLVPQYSGNVQLLQGRDLLLLDRWAALRRMEDVISILSGLGNELAFNDGVGAKWAPLLAQAAAGVDITWLAARFRVDAVSGYLTRPVLATHLDTRRISLYRELADICNHMFDVLYATGSAPSNRAEVLAEIAKHVKGMGELAGGFRVGLEAASLTLGPLARL